MTPKAVWSGFNTIQGVTTDWSLRVLWVSSNPLQFFDWKTCLLHQLTIQMDNQTINRTNCTKFLGLFIDDKMKWETHINNMKSRISRSLYAINKIKHFTPSKIFKTLYYSMVYPYLTYGITLWGNTCKQYTNKLKVMQKKVMSAISGDGYNAHTNHTFFK